MAILTNDSYKTYQDLIDLVPYESLVIVDGTMVGYLMVKTNTHCTMKINKKYEDVERSRITVPPYLAKILEPEIKRMKRDIRIDNLIKSKYNRQTEYEIAKAKYKRSENEDH